MNDTTTLQTLPERFNFAQYLLGVNAQRQDKTAFIDEHGGLS